MINHYTSESGTCSSHCDTEAPSHVSTNGRSRSSKMLLVAGLVSQAASASFVQGFTVPPSSSKSHHIISRGINSNSCLYQSGGAGSDDITAQLERAKALIAKSKAKIEEKNGDAC